MGDAEAAGQAGEPRLDAGPEVGQEVGPADAWSWPAGDVPPDALILAIDTAARTGGVALLRGRALVGEETWLAGGSQTSQVLPAAARLWQRAGISPRDLYAVVVSTGPGSFTGLRVGASLAKGFALASGSRLVGVPALDVVAYQHRQAAAQICALVDAGRGHYYAGAYESPRGRLRRAGEYAALSLEQLSDRLEAQTPRPLLGGDLDAAAVAALRRRLGGVLRVASPAATVRRPAYLAELGLWRLLTEPPADPAALQPIYLSRGAVP